MKLRKQNIKKWSKPATAFILGLAITLVSANIFVNVPTNTLMTAPKKLSWLILPNMPWAFWTFIFSLLQTTISGFIMTGYIDSSRKTNAK